MLQSVFRESVKRFLDSSSRSRFGALPLRLATHDLARLRLRRHAKLAMRQEIHSLFAGVVNLVRRDKSGGRGLSLARGVANRLIIVGLVAGDQDRRLLAAVSGRNNWNLVLAGSCEEARTLSDRFEAPVVLCDRDLAGSQWRAAVEALASSLHPTCILLISRVVDDYLRDEVVRSGGYDVLCAPLREHEVLRAIKLAWSYWNSAMKKAG